MKKLVKVLLIIFLICIFSDILVDILLIGLLVYGGYCLWNYINSNFRLIKLNKPRHNSHGRRKR